MRSIKRAAWHGFCTDRPKLRPLSTISAPRVAHRVDMSERGEGAPFSPIADPSSPAAAPASILPLAVLTEVFRYAPVPARLLALSRVCKRWHTAALRSINSIRPALGNSAVIPSALLASLTELDLRWTAARIALRALGASNSLRRLTVGHAGCLAGYLPHLESLALVSLKDFQSEAAVAFLGTHSQQLAELTLGPLVPLSFQLTPNLMSLTWPVLRKLTARRVPPFAIDHFLNHASAVTELWLEAPDNEFMMLSEHSLTALVSFEYSMSINPIPDLHPPRPATHITARTSAHPQRISAGGSGFYSRHSA